MSAVSMPMPITRIRNEDHQIGSTLRGLLQLLESRLLDLLDFLGDELLPLEVAAQFGERVGRDRLALGRAHVFQALRRLLELGIEAADAEPRQGRLDAVGDGGLLANEGLALTVGALGILLRKGRDRAHLAVLPLATQPAEEGAFELFGVEAVGLGAPVLPRHRHARGMNDVGLNPACCQPARQPEAVPTGLEGNRNTLDLVTGLLRFLSPSLEQL